MFAGKSEDFVSVLFFEVKLEKYYNKYNNNYKNGLSDMIGPNTPFAVH